MFDITNIPSICSTRLRSDVSGYETDTAIINVEYNTRYELCSCFMRIQEFYESDIPVIRGNYFTLDQYMDEYAKKNGGFSYTMDWSGFNIPSRAYRGFIAVFPEYNMLPKERTLIVSIRQELRRIGLDENATFYIIGSYKECPRQASVIQHEIAHAMYALDNEYRAYADIVGTSIPQRDEIVKVLKEWGYADSVIDDEVQAYVGTNSSRDWTSFPKVDTKNKAFKDLKKGLYGMLKSMCEEYGIWFPTPHTVKKTKELEREYKKKYGYNSGEMI